MWERLQSGCIHTSTPRSRCEISHSWVIFGGQSGPLLQGPFQLIKQRRLRAWAPLFFGHGNGLGLEPELDGREATSKLDEIKAAYLKRAIRRQMRPTNSNVHLSIAWDTKVHVDQLAARRGGRGTHGSKRNETLYVAVTERLKVNKACSSVATLLLFTVNPWCPTSATLPVLQHAASPDCVP